MQLIPVAENHRPAVEELGAGSLEQEDMRADVDERDDTLGKRIRDAELEKVPLHDRLRRSRVGNSLSLAVRERGGEQSTLGLEELQRTVPRKRLLRSRP